MLRHVQFNTCSRIDELVEGVIDQFKHEFYPKETVNLVRDGVKEDCAILDKVEFPSRPDELGQMQPPTVRYTVSLKKKAGTLLTITDPTSLGRPRRHFNKASIRAFLKNCVMKENLTGAPWLVKEEYARHYSISMEIPLHLRRDYLLTQRDLKANAPKKPIDKTFLQDLANRGRLPGVPAGTVLSSSQLRHFADLAAREVEANRHKQPLFQINGPAGEANGHGVHGTFTEFQLQQLQQLPTQAPSKKQMKFPCEDLDLPRKKKPDYVRPKLNKLNSDYPSLVNVEQEVDPSNVVGYLLQIWSTMNVFSDFFIIDNFSMEDLVQGIAIASVDQPVELYEEIHCALLKCVIDEDKDIFSKSLIETRQRSWDDAVGELEDAQEEEEPEAPRTRSARKSRDAAESQKPVKPLPLHYAFRVQSEDEWINNMAKADFAFGGWQIAMVGLLSMLSLKDRFRSACDRLLAKLVPSKDDGADEIMQHYGNLDFASRVEALHLLVSVAAETKPLKARMEDLEAKSTDIRKDKIKVQSQRKPLLAKRLRLEGERKILHPDAVDSSEPPANGKEAEQDDADRTQSDPGSPAASHDDDDEEDEDVTQMSTRSRAGRELKRKREEELAEDRVKGEKAAKKAKTQKAPESTRELTREERFLQVVEELDATTKQIAEYDEEIAEYDEQLRQRFCHRSRLLGKDRYLNYYYWFERNGMGFAGKQQGLTAQAEYMNGCVWIHGPDPLEADGVINLTPAEHEEYESTHDISLTDRRAQDEGETQLADANHWGYLDTPDQLDALMQYLDDKGERERKLKKELKTWKDQVITRMGKRQAYLHAVNDRLKKEESEELAPGVAQRRKRDDEGLRKKFPVLKWQNFTARHTFSRSAIHSTGGR